MSAREEVLGRVRTALAGGSGDQDGHAEVARTYRLRGAEPPGDPALLDLLVDRLLDYRAGVRRTTVADLPATIAQALSEGLARALPASGHPAPARDPATSGGAATRRPRVVVPPALPAGWLGSADVEAVADEGFGAQALDDFDAVVTAAAVAVAETGTIVLDAGPDQGRRALTLVPDLHVCVVRADQVVAGVPDAVALLDATRPLTWISGPSATSDIELNRVEGVHGPRTLEVVLVGP